MTKTKGMWVLLFFLPTVALAAYPPTTINYQGVLRSASEAPIDGTVSMTFSLWSAASGGDEILVDAHSTVVVSKGLFSVAIGGGVISDGTGPGSYGYLPAVFADYRDVYLQVQVNGEVLSPRTKIASSAYAFNARYVNGVEVATGTGFSLYVNGGTGNDNNSGLSPAAAKRTIQAAIDRIPSILRGEVTVLIAPETYYETVTIAGRSAPGGHRIRLVGDASNPASTRISGGGVRERALKVSDCATVDLEGLRFEDTAGTENAAGDGVEYWRSNGSIVSCQLANNPNSGLMAYQSYVQVRNAQFVGNRFGMDVLPGSYVVLDNISVTGSTQFGLFAEHGGAINAAGPITITGSAYEGCRAESGGFIDLGGGDLVIIQSNNAGGSQMLARLHGVIVGYENAVIDSPACSEVSGGTCHPGQY